MKTKALNCISCFMFGIGIGCIIASFRNHYHKPQVGDVYAEYVDDRDNQYAITNGFPAEVVIIEKVTAVSNDVVYRAMLEKVITNTGEYPFPYNQWGPSDNYRKYPQYRTLLKPIP